MDKRGIVLIAGGHPFYGTMARNLAMGIRLYSQMPIALFHDGIGASHFTDFDKSLFQPYELPKYTYQYGDKISYLRCKTFLYELSPFKETIFFDVDLIWHKGRRIDELFESLKDCEFQMTNEGHLDFKTGENTISRNYHFWSKPEEIKEAYKSEKTLKDARLYQFRSEFIYFKKTDDNKKFFALARKIYDNPKMKSIMFGDVLPDEAAFDVAAAILHHYPEHDSSTPVYWDYLYAFLRYERKELFEKYYAFSMGGRQVRDVQKNLYNDMVRYYLGQYGQRVPSSDEQVWIDKRNFDKQRQNI